MDTWWEVPMAKAVSAPQGTAAMSTHANVGTPLRDCSHGRNIPMQGNP